MRCMGLLFLLLLAAMPVPARASDYTDLKLVITDAEKGTPVPRAAVTLKFAKEKKFRKDEKFEWEAKTDGTGHATIPYVLSGKIRVLVFAKGFQTFGEDFTISGPEQTIEVKLNRPTTQYSAHDTPEEPKSKEKKKEK